MNHLRGSVRGGVLEVPGGRLALEGLSVSDAAHADFFFRPESAAVAPPDGAPLRGRVTAALFLGERTRLVVEGVADGPIVAEAPGHQEFAEGQTVGLTLEPTDLLRLPG
jgi:putative spermidine/putrescine transport system ATP-binding protein